MTAATLSAFWPGRVVDLAALKPSDIDFTDLATRMSRQRRFAGGTRVDQHGYSTAQHSVRVMDLLPKHARVYGLLHDAPEAYCSELTAPAWALLDQCAPVRGHIRVAQLAMHERILLPILQAAGVRWPSAETQFLVDEADRQACADELAALCGVDPTEYGLPRATTSIIRVEDEADALRTFKGALQQCGIDVRY